MKVVVCADTCLRLRHDLDLFDPAFRRARQPQLEAADTPRLDSLQRWFAATLPQPEQVAPPLCNCHQPGVPMRWHKDSRRKAGGYFDCAERVAELRHQRAPNAERIVTA